MSSRERKQKAIEGAGYPDGAPHPAPAKKLAPAKNPVAGGKEPSPEPSAPQGSTAPPDVPPAAAPPPVVPQHVVHTPAALGGPRNTPHGTPRPQRRVSMDPDGDAPRPIAAEFAGGEPFEDPDAAFSEGLSETEIELIRAHRAAQLRVQQNAAARLMSQATGQPAPAPLVEPPLEGPQPEDELAIGLMVYVWHRGRPQPYPAWVTAIRARTPDNARAHLILTMLTDRNPGSGIIVNPVHISRRRFSRNDTYWDFLPDDPDAPAEGG